VFAPLHLFAATPELQRHAEAPGVFVEHAQIELHDVPADDRVGIVPGEPVVELFEQQGARVAVFELEIHLLASPFGAPSMYTCRSPQPSRAMEYSSPWAVVSMSRETSLQLRR
jgi:hypothetical protein